MMLAIPFPAATDSNSQTVLLRLRTDNAMLMLLGHIVDLDIVQRAPAQAVLQNQPGSFGMDMHFDDIADNSYNQRITQRLESTAYNVLFDFSFLNDKFCTIRSFPNLLPSRKIGEGWL